MALVRHGVFLALLQALVHLQRLRALLLRVANLLLLLAPVLADLLEKVEGVFIDLLQLRIVQLLHERGHVRIEQLLAAHLARAYLLPLLGRNLEHLVHQAVNVEALRKALDCAVDLAGVVQLFGRVQRAQLEDFRVLFLEVLPHGKDEFVRIDVVGVLVKLEVADDAPGEPQVLVEAAGLGLKGAVFNLGVEHEDLASLLALVDTAPDATAVPARLDLAGLPRRGSQIHLRVVGRALSALRLSWRLLSVHPDHRRSFRGFQHLIAVLHVIFLEREEVALEAHGKILLGGAAALPVRVVREHLVHGLWKLLVDIVVRLADELAHGLLAALQSVRHRVVILQHVLLNHLLDLVLLLVVETGQVDALLALALIEEVEHGIHGLRLLAKAGLLVHDA